MNYSQFNRLTRCLKSWCQEHKELLSLVFLAYSVCFVILHEAGVLPHPLVVLLAILWCLNLALCLNGKH